MIYSMTAFANSVEPQDSGVFTWELRSVNHRYLELSLRLPEVLRVLEPALREQIRQRVQRGKIECTLKYQPNPHTLNAVRINAALVQQLAQAEQQIQQVWPHLLPSTAMTVLAWPNVLQLEETPWENIQTAALTSFAKLLQEFLRKRQTEGQALQGYLKDRLQAFRKVLNEIKSYLPDLMRHQQQKIAQRFNELQLETTPERLAQEVALLLQKADVAEELARLEIHIQEIQTILQQGGAVGKRLDFLLQELNREANTLAAKSLETQTTFAAVELKVLIEQLREQVQNIE